MNGEGVDEKVFFCPRCREATQDRLTCEKCGALLSPFSDNPDMWILLPNRWLGEHAMKYSQVLAEMSEMGDNKGVVMTNFAAAMALMVDWNLPGLTGNPEKWDFGKIDLPIIAWVNYHVITNGFLKCFSVPINF